MSLIRTGSRRNARRVSSMLRLEMLETRQLLATFPVLNTNDAGPDSLRAAIAGVNTSSDTTNFINFNIAGGGVHTIALLSELDAISKPVTIDGTNGNSTPSIELNGAGAGASADGLRLTGGASSVTGLIINRFSGNGITIANIGGDSITNTWIGVNNTDTGPSANGGDGVLIDNVPNNFIGGTASGAKNVIGGNTGNGVRITGATAQNNVVLNSAIGTDLTGVLNLGNIGDGVHVDAGASNNSVGGVATNQANTIAFNHGSGVNVVDGNGINIRRNSIFTNTTLGITLATGANHDQPAPVLTSAKTSGGITTVSGTLNAAASTTYTVEVFSNTTPDPSGNGQGRTYIGTTQVTTNAAGLGTFSVATLTPVAINQFVSSTATSTTGDTSEFSNNVTNTAPTVDLSITGTASPNPVANGGYLVYTFVITNTGPDSASNVTFLDTLPTGVSFVQAVASQGTITRSSSVVTGSLGAMNAGSTATVTITVVPTAVNAALANTGTVTASEDSSSGNNSATVTSAVVSGINLSVTAATNPPSPTVGSPLTFVYTVTNSGSVAATNVVLTSDLPTTGVTFTSTSATQGTSTASGGKIIANLGTLAVGASAQVFVVFNPTATGTVTQSATVSGTEPEINTQTQTATATATVAAAPTPPSVVNGPTVTFLRRYGIHGKRTSVQTSFNQALDSATAEDLANYTLVYTGKRPKPIRISTARYDNLTQSVILNTRRPVNLHKQVQLTINGTSSTGVANFDGVLLDGANTGKPGSNFVYAFRGFGPGVIG